MNLIKRPFRYSFNNVTLILAGITVLMYMVSRLYPQCTPYLAMNPLLMLKYHFFWQCATYMFVHADLNHLLINMISLVMFGIAVERRLGSREFLLLYMLTGIISGLVSFAVYCLTGQWLVSLVGASGAIFGLLFAYAVLYPHARILVFYVLPVPAPLMILLYAGYELCSGIFGAGGSIAHGTHLAGFAVAWLYFVIRLGIHPLQVWKSSNLR